MHLYELNYRTFGIWHRIWNYFLVSLVEFSVKWLKVSGFWETRSELQVTFFVIFYFLWFWSDYLSSRWMILSDKYNYNRVNWDYMLRNGCQHNISQVFEKNRYILIFHLPINFKSSQDAIWGIIFYIHINASS